MVYYVAYKVSGELKYRSQIVRRLRALGCRQIRRSFWEVDKTKIGSVIKILQDNFVVILKRTREVRKPYITPEGTFSELGSLVVVAYKIPEEAKKGKIKSLLKRAPCIRLSRGVYAFAQRHKRFDKNRELVDARTFWGLVREVDANAVMVPRVIVANNQIVESLLEDVRRRVEKEVNSINEGFRILSQKVKHEELNRRHTLRITRNLRRRFMNAKKLAAFYKEWLRIDFSSILIKPYPAMREVRYVLQERYGST